MVPQPVNMDADRGFHRFTCRPPDIFQKLDAGEDLVGICEEFVQEKELFQGKCKYIAAAADGHCIIIKRGRADRESVIGSNTGAP